LGNLPAPVGVALAALLEAVGALTSNTAVTPVTPRVQEIVEVIAVGFDGATKAVTVPKAKAPLKAPTVHAEVNVAVTLKVLDPTAACAAGVITTNALAIVPRAKSFFI
jgi:hypothetical protein